MASRRVCEQSYIAVGMSLDLCIMLMDCAKGSKRTQNDSLFYSSTLLEKLNSSNVGNIWNNNASPRYHPLRPFSFPSMIDDHMMLIKNGLLFDNLIVYSCLIIEYFFFSFVIFICGLAMCSHYTKKFIRIYFLQLDFDSAAPPEQAWRRRLNSHANILKEFSVTFVEAIKMVIIY